MTNPNPNPFIGGSATPPAENTNGGQKNTAPAPEAPNPTSAPTAAPDPAMVPPPSHGRAANDTFEVDLSAAESSFLVPDGIYHMRCIGIEQTISKSGNPMFVWTFTIVSGDHAGKEFKLFTVTTPAAMWKVAECVHAFGIGEAGEVVKFKASDVINRECGALIEESEYQGQKRSSIVRLMTLSEMTAQV